MNWLAESLGRAEKLLLEAAAENERLRAAAVDGHCRKCICDDCVRFYYELGRFA